MLAIKPLVVAEPISLAVCVNLACKLSSELKKACGIFRSIFISLSMYLNTLRLTLFENLVKALLNFLSIAILDFIGSSVFGFGIFLLAISCLLHQSIKFF